MQTPAKYSPLQLISGDGWFVLVKYKDAEGKEKSEILPVIAFASYVSFQAVDDDPPEYEFGPMIQWEPGYIKLVKEWQEDWQDEDSWELLDAPQRKAWLALR